MKLTKVFVAMCAGYALACSVQANENMKPVATVNGVKIDGEVLELLVTNNVSQGVKDSPELRAALRHELVVREVLAQEARKQKLDQEAAVKAQMFLQQNALLADALIARQASKINITDEKLRAEYKRQVDLLTDADEFQISHVVTATEAQARAVIKAARDGETFDKLARDKSIGASRQNGGSLGWLLASQITPALANVVVNLPVSAVTSLPIATPEGWQVIRLDAKRKFKVPNFEESKQQILNAVLANERAEFVQKLVKSANILQ